MSAHIRELEAALAKKSDNRPPLLAGTVSLASQSSSEKPSSHSARVGASSSEPETDLFIDAFGISDLHLAVWCNDTLIRNTDNRHPWRNQLHE